MKEQWKAELNEIPRPNTEQGRIYKEQVEKLIENLLAEQRKEMLGVIGIEIDKGNDGKVTYITENSIKQDLINQILSEAPEYLHIPKTGDIDNMLIITTFNETNQQWRELLTKHLK